MTDHTRFTPDPIAEYKQQAKRLRATLAEQGTTVSHGAALELIARQHGARDWNTLVATTPATSPPAKAAPSLRFAVGATVSGRYLGQAFTGKVLALSAQAGGLYRITLHFDTPVDVVTFDSFQALRRRVNAVIDADGVSPRRTSNGLSHLTIDA